MAESILKELLEAGAHFGHQTRRWNPKMQRYIYGVRGGIHIIDLTKTADLLKEAQRFAKETAANGGAILFVGTKRQGKAIIKQEAEQAGMPYVAERWLGGMLTNFRTIRTQINRLKKLAEQQESGGRERGYSKKEQHWLDEEQVKLTQIFGGVHDLDQVPAALFVVDLPRERIAVAEARKLNIPIIAVVDTNADPDLVDYPIPANDDAIKSIQVITHAIAEAAAEGAKAHQAGAKERAAEPEAAAAK